MVNTAKIQISQNPKHNTTKTIYLQITLTNPETNHIPNQKRNTTKNNRKKSKHNLKDKNRKEFSSQAEIRKEKLT